MQNKFGLIIFRKGALLLLLCAGATFVTAQSERAVRTPPRSNAPPPTVEPFRLNQVELLESPFKAAMERNAKYLLSLDADRFLHNTRKYAGLPPKAAIYEGWEARGIAGHSLGHYLTAISQQYAATGDARFRDRVAYIVREMDECQRTYGDGYVGALPPLELQTLRGFRDGRIEVESNFNFKGGSWVPWYTQHKVLAGLKDAWALAGNEQAKQVTLKLADWVDEVTRELTTEQVQQMLRVEHGGMNETLADIYELTGDEKYLNAARRFYHEAIMQPMIENRDDLPGKHANTQIPKVIGQARLYEVAGDWRGRTIAQFFWDRVVNHHSYVIGGHSEGEHFGEPDKLSKRLGPTTAETCNTYNMLKLTRHLFEWRPRAEHFDFYERALYNHILGSQEPDQGMFAYFISLKPGHFKTYSTPTASFWCCVGSGMENHTKYNDSIYFRGPNDLYVNLFIPSRLRWEEKGLTVEQKTAYPRADQIELRFTANKSVPLSLKVRSPRWAAGNLRFRLNGKTLTVESSPGSYAEIDRVWKGGDVLQVTIPMAVRAEAMPDDPTKVALLYGPVVLAGDLGETREPAPAPYSKMNNDYFHRPVADVPTLVTKVKDLPDAIKRAAGDELVFSVDAAVTRPRCAVTLRPFNEIFYNYYNVYWDVLTEEQYAERKAAREAESARRAAIDARTVDEYRPGEQQSEVDHQQKGENTSAGDAMGGKYRHARDGGWFSFRVKIRPDGPNELLCTYWGGERGDDRTFDILVDGKIIAAQTLNQDKPGEFFDKTYPVPVELTRGKETVEVRFQARPGNYAGGLFGFKVLR